MADGSHTRATKVDSWTSTYSRFPDRARSLKCRETVGAILCGDADGRELFYLGPDGTMMSVPIGARTFIRCRTAAGPLSRKRLDPRAQPGLRRDQRRAALPRHGDATEVQRRGAADRRPQLDGCAQQVATRSTRTDGGRLASRLTRLSGSLRFGASSWSVGSIWDKSGPPTFAHKCRRRMPRQSVAERRGGGPVLCLNELGSAAIHPSASFGSVNQSEL